MTTYFISDLHLQASQPAILRHFIQFMQQHTVDAEAIYILGDLFEAWIGDDDLSLFVQTVKIHLKQVTTRGVPIYFMHGNRDFVIGARFADETGVTLLPDPTVINLYGRPTLLAHGDLLCIDDLQYQAYRQKIRNPKLIARLLKLPLFARRIISVVARILSKAHTRKTDRQIQDVNQAEVEKIMQQHGVDLLIHGHTHRPATHALILNGKPAQRIVLAAWHNHGHVLAISPEGQLTTFTLE